MKAPKNVLITDRFDHDVYLSLQSLQNQNNLRIVRAENPFNVDPQELYKAHALIIRSRTKITDELLKLAPELQLIITCTSGYDHIDFEAINKWGITVMHTPDANTESAAQLTWALLLSCANKTRAAYEAVRNGTWARETLVGLELNGKTLGVVGLGRIGGRVAQIGAAFGMKILAFDPYQEDSAFENSGALRVSYEELLKSSDVLTFHVPATPETKHMLNRSHFEYIQRGVIILNTSRGNVIQELDLVDALSKGWLWAVGLDVFGKEPLPTDSALLKFQNVILTPHIGANTDDAFFKGSQLAADKLLRFFMDSTATNTLPPKVNWNYRTP